MATAADVARSYFESVSARDPEAMASHWSADGVDDLVPIGILRGPGEVRDFFRGLFAAIPDAEMTVDRISADERTAAVQWRLVGTFDGAPFQGIDPTGKRMELRGCDCLEVEGGKVVRNTAYYDGMAFARAVGMMPPLDSPAERAMKTAFNGLTKLRGALR
ncbi:MAG: ester cyclase [Thermoleophilaceae bacterium]